MSGKEGGDFSVDGGFPFAVERDVENNPAGCEVFSRCQELKYARDIHAIPVLLTPAKIIPNKN